MFKTIFRTTTPLAAFALGVVGFPRSWLNGGAPPIDNNAEILDSISTSPEFRALEAKGTAKHTSSSAFPHQHRANYITTGILSGRGHFEIDPVVFVDNDELVSFYHLGEKLVSTDGQIHNGIVSTLLDEGLCTCGFGSLPAKKGVTASLSIDFKSQAQPESNVVLRAHVVEKKGRKVVIEGNLSDLATGVEIASAHCVLVQPKWFRYLLWVNVI